MRPSRPWWTRSPSSQKWAKQFGYSATDAFAATYQPPGSPPQQSLFYTGKVGLQIDGNWAVEALKDYAPKVHYGVTYLPVPRKGDPPASWSGGFGMSIPSGAANPDGAWKFIRYASGPIGQRIMFEDTGELPSYRSVLADKKLMASQQFFVDLLEAPHHQPATAARHGAVLQRAGPGAGGGAARRFHAATGALGRGEPGAGEHGPVLPVHPAQAGVLTDADWAVLI